MEYVKIENGIIAELISTASPPKGKNWIPVEKSFQGHTGMDERMIDWDTGLLRPEEELAAQGIIEDNRGMVWNTETMQEREITRIGEAAPENHTKLPPPDDPEERSYCRWDGSAWVINREAMEKAALENQLTDKQRYLTDTDWYVTRKAETGQSVPEDVAKKRQTAREEIDALREEMKAE